MKKDVIIPRLGSSDESDEVRILRWLKTPGTEVKKGEALLEVETDKVNVEIEAPDDGRLDPNQRAGRRLRQVRRGRRGHR